MPLSVKICGLATADDVDAALAAGADLLGFVMVTGSVRAVAPDRARALAERVAGRATTVGLFAEGDPGTVAALAADAGVDAIQWHPRTFDRARVRDLRRAWDGLFIAAAAATPPTVAALSAVDTDTADLLLFDAPPPSGSAVAGGHGAAFDTRILSGYAGALPFLLAGGLTCETVGSAIAAASRHKGFAGVDVSSGVERRRGIKDPGLIAQFVTAARDGATAASG